MTWIRSHAAYLVLGGALALAGAAGLLASKALGIGTAGPPAETTTITIPAGQQGPEGPPGPQGPPGPPGTGGADQCPTGSTFKAVVVSAPGGHVELWVCVKN